MIKIYVDKHSIPDKAVIMVVNGHDPMHSEIVDSAVLQYSLHDLNKRLKEYYPEREIAIHGETLEKNYYG